MQPIITLDDPSDPTTNDFSMDSAPGTSAWISIGGVEVHLYVIRYGEVHVSIGRRVTAHGTKATPVEYDPDAPSVHDPAHVVRVVHYADPHRAPEVRS